MATPVDIVVFSLGALVILGILFLIYRFLREKGISEKKDEKKRGKRSGARDGE
ncbi:MAG TPA: hypothetical protein VFF09_01515 [archaeon]|nr:hypothetical protein [archaeon]